jgi:dipeptidyl aminopeptidase/acylaminoacyl peptidase
MSSPITPESAVYDVKSLNSSIVSPDGSSVAYVVSQTDRKTGKGVGHIWLCDIDGGNPRQLTQSGATNGYPAWSPDGASIAYVSQRDGDHPGAIVVLPLSGGESRVITKHASGPSSIAWSPNGTSIAYQVEVDPDNPDETPRAKDEAPPVIVVDRLDYKLDGRGVFNRKRTQVHVVDVESGERRRLSGPEVHHTSPRWSPDGSTIAVIHAFEDSPNTSIALIDVASGAISKQSSVTGSTSNLWWTPDGSGILYLGDPELSAHADYYLLDVASGSTRVVATNLQFLPDIGYQNTAPPGVPVWLSDTTAIVHGLRGGASVLWLLDIESGSLTELAEWQAMHGGLSATPDGGTIVQSRASMAGTGELVAWNRASGVTTTLVSVNSELFANTPTAAWESISFDRAGLTIEGWLLKPQDFDASKKYPLVLSVHGGPHNAYGYTFDVQAQVLATNGYLVLMINPRGSGTYSREFAGAVHGDWGGEDWNDLMAAVDLIIERPYIDSAKLGIYGYSYGGYITAWAVGNTDRFAAIVCGAPVYDMVSMYGTSDIGFFFTPNQMQADPVKDRDKLIERSPSTYAHKAKTPTLIIQGEADERCPVGQAEQMFVDLKLAGCETQLVRYPGGSHLMLARSHASHRIDYLERVRSWFDSHLTKGNTSA